MKKYIEKNQRKHNSEKGITLITLVVAVSIMIIISGMLIYNAKNGIKMRNLKMMQNDIDLLNNKVDAYYVKYGALPAEIEYNVTPLPFASYNSPNDNEKYYVLDLKAFEGLTLNYGADFANITAENVADYTDLYVINEQSHHIYYVRGIEIDGVIYYTNDEDEEVKISEGKIIDAIGTRNGIIVLTSKNKVKYFKNLKEDAISSVDLDDSELISEYGIRQKGYNFFIDNNGKLYTWGDGKNDKTGNGNFEYIEKPMCISDIEGICLKDKNIIHVYDIYEARYAIDSNGNVYSWGRNCNGMIGKGEERDITNNYPTCISDIELSPLYNKNIIEIKAIGSYNFGWSVMARDINGKIYTWGGNRAYQLGNGQTADSISSMPICISDMDTPLKNKNIVKIYSFYNSVFVIDDNNNIYSWGRNSNGELGNGTTESSSVPICISDTHESDLENKQIVQMDYYIDYYSSTVLAIDIDGKVYVWGKNNLTQLNDGTIKSSSLPICISDIEGSALTGKHIVEIYTNDETIIARDINGQLYAWGLNTYGQLGNGTTESSSMPICISNIEGSALNGKNIVKVLDRYYNIFAIDDLGKIYTWGENTDGELGNGTTENSNLPVCISELENSA